ncbi:hypothetical protein LY76DRAFT_602461 [Colletotrichum caudatum]|nr:hypothetical protein LY76DRAFT_602461 [Colletotrichum caudatum]
MRSNDDDARTVRSARSTGYLLVAAGPLERLQGPREMLPLAEELFGASSLRTLFWDIQNWPTDRRKRKAKTSYLRQIPSELSDLELELINETVVRAMLHESQPPSPSPLLQALNKRVRLRGWPRGILSLYLDRLRFNQYAGPALYLLSRLVIKNYTERRHFGGPEDLCHSP